VSRQRLRGLAPLANAAKRCSPPLQRRGLSGRLFDTKVFHSLFPTTPKQIGIKRHLGSMKNTRRSMSSAALNVAAPKRVESSVLSGKSARDGLCQFPFTDGRTCRMPIAENHPCLCLFHSRDERQLLASQEVPARLASLSGHFKTASDINHVLGQLFRLVAENRLSADDLIWPIFVVEGLHCPAPSANLAPRPRRNQRSPYSGRLGNDPSGGTMPQVARRFREGASRTKRRQSAIAAFRGGRHNCAF